MSNNLNITLVAANQNQKEVTINDGFGALDAALTEMLTVDLSAGDVTLTSAQYRGSVGFLVSGNAVARTLTLPQVKRGAVWIKNGGTATLSIARGATTLALAAGGYAFYATDGTANGLFLLDISAAVSVTDLTSSVKFSGDITPAQITADQNDYNPAGLSTASVLRLSTDATRALTGLSGGSDGRIVVIQNVGSFSLLLKNENASSSAANRFALASDMRVEQKQCATLQYDSTSSRWRSVSAPGASRGVLGVFAPGVLADAQLIFRFVAASDFVLEAGAPGWQATAGNSSTGDVSFSIRKNGAEVGTVRFNISAAGTFTFTADAAFAAGDRLEILAPATHDTTLADVSITLRALKA